MELGEGSASGGGVSDTLWQSLYATITYAGGKPTVAWYDNVLGQMEIYAATLEGDEWVPAGSGATSGGGISDRCVLHCLYIIYQRRGFCRPPAVALRSEEDLTQRRKARQA